MDLPSPCSWPTPAKRRLPVYSNISRRPRAIRTPSTKERASALPNPQPWPILVSDTNVLHYWEKGGARGALAQVRRLAELRFMSLPPLPRHAAPTRAPELTETHSMIQHNDIRISILRRRRSASSTSSFRLQTLPTWASSPARLRFPFSRRQSFRLVLSER